MADSPGSLRASGNGRPGRIIPIHPAPAAHARGQAIQRTRLGFQAGFFLLFILAPVLDLFRYDLNSGHAWLLTFPWKLGLDAFSRGEIGALEAASNVLLKLFLPIFAGAGVFIWAAWRWGRLYCGWLCPHFSVVERINRLMRRANGKPSVWDRKAVPPFEPDGTPLTYDARWWLAVVPAAIAFAFVWAVVLLTYLLPPAEVYGNLWAGTPTRNQGLFIGIGTLVLTVEFLFARHLFCRFACAVGLFQSLAWMGNRRALVVGFARNRAAECADCRADCEHACPMRLKPRSIKRKMFTCTQCRQCVDACATVKRASPTGPLLTWVEGDAARRQEASVSLTGHRD